MTFLSRTSIHEATLSAIAAANSAVQLRRSGVGRRLLWYVVSPEVAQVWVVILVLHDNVAGKRYQ